MRTLALETSLRSGSIALLDTDRVVWQSELPATERTAQTLVPGIRQAFECAGWSSRDVDLVAVVSGPGSFTGLRIGVTTAKVFAHAVGAEIMDVDTLEVLAAQCPPAQPPQADASELWAVMDAQRGELFAARFQSENRETWTMVTPTHVVPRDTWYAQIDAHAAITGLGLRGLEQRIAPTGPSSNTSAGRLPGAYVTPPESWAPRAETVGRLALLRYAAGQRCDVWHVLPRYFRLSAAEEKRG